MNNKLNLVAKSCIIIACGAALSLSAPVMAQFDLGGFLDKATKAAKIAKGVSQATTEMTEEQEVLEGDAMAAQFLGSAQLHSNADLQRYVNKVGRWIALHSDRPNLNWTFAVLDMPALNAFAVPGGTVFVSSGLMKKMKSEAELAGVLAHEIAHVTQRHHVKAIMAGGWKAAGGEVAGILVERSKASAIGKQATSAAVSALGSVYAKGLDKGDEFEADRVGLIYAARAGYDPYGLPSVLQKLSSATQADSGFSLMMSTHPTAIARIEKIEEFSPVLDRFSSFPQLETRFQRATAGLK